LAEAVPYLILDARDERVREAGVLIAIGINWDGRRRVLAIELANREGPVEFPAGAQSARSARRRVWS
jgi:transposase-like protein